MGNILFLYVSRTKRTIVNKVLYGREEIQNKLIIRKSDHVLIVFKNNHNISFYLSVSKKVLLKELQAPCVASLHHGNKRIYFEVHDPALGKYKQMPDYLCIKRRRVRVLEISCVVSAY